MEIERMIDNKEADVMMSTTIEYEKHDFLAELEESLKEVKLMREGKKPKRNWNSFMEQLKKEMEKDK